MNKLAPSWADPELLSAKPASGAFGFIDDRGSITECDSLELLCRQILNSRNGVDLVWTPDSSRLRIPEELAELDDVLWRRSYRRAKRDCTDGLKLGALFGVVVLWTVLWAMQKFGGDLEAIVSYPSFGISLVLLFVFGFLPWYEGRKRLKRGCLNEGEREEIISEVRFEMWIEQQPVTMARVILGLFVLVGVAQLWVLYGRGVSSIGAGVLKPNVEWWRYWTAAFLHGNILHWVMNTSALLFLAKRVEVLARWPHLVTVYCFCLLAGGYASVLWNPAQPTVGASGAILGLLGFLLVFESRHQRLVPRSARKRLLAGLGMTALMGLLGFSFIDNAAHAGGLLAGGVYALICFAKTDGVNRVKVPLFGYALGGCALLALVLAAVLTVFKVLSS